MKSLVVPTGAAQACRQVTPVGSRMTCDPAPTGTDQDWLVFVPSARYEEFAKALLGDGWVVGGSMIPADVDYTPVHERFNSFTKGEDNVIATASEKFHRRFLAASAAAKRLNLLKKKDRIDLFQAVLYAAIADPAFEVSLTADQQPAITEMEEFL